MFIVIAKQNEARMIKSIENIIILLKYYIINVEFY